MGQWLRDPVYGKPIWQDDDGLFNVVDQGGRVSRIGADGLERTLLSKGGAGERFRPARAEEIGAHDTEKRIREGGLSRAVGTFAENAAKATYDAATAPIRAPVALGYALAGEESPLEEVASGEAVAQGLSAILGELGGGDETGEAQALRGAEERRLRAQDMPGTALAGRVAGEVAASVATGGVSGALEQAAGRVATTKGAEAAARVGAFAAEGAAFGATQATEDAYVQNTDLTAEAVLHQIGLGALFGAGAGGVATGGSALVRRLQGKPSRLEGILGPAPDVPPASSLQEQARSVLGVEPSPLLGQKARELLVDAQDIATGGGHRELLERASPFRWDDEAMHARDMIARRSEIVDGARQSMTKNLDDTIRANEDLRDVWGSAVLKKEHVTPLLDGDDALARAAMFDEGQRVVDDMATLELEAERLGALKLDPEGLAHNKRILNDVRAIARSAADASAGDDVAAGFVAFDGFKRALQRHVVSLRSAAPRYAAEAQANKALAEALEGIQERVRLHLESDVYGAAGAAQKEVNGAYSEMLRSSQVVRQDLMRMVESQGYETGRPVFRADDDKLAGYLNKIGVGKGSLTDEMVRSNIAASKRIGEALQKHFPGSDLASVGQRQVAAADSFSSSLSKADETLGVANQLDALVKAEQEQAGMLGQLGAGGALVGSLFGGPVGAVVGGGLGLLAQAVARPSVGMRQAAALQHVTRKLRANMGSRIRATLSGTVDRTARVAGGTRKALKAAGSQGRRAAVAGLVARYEDARENVETAATHPAEMLERVALTLGPDASTSFPKTVGAMGARAGAAAAFLSQKMPITPPAPLFPADDAPPIAPHEMEKFLRYYDATTKPVETLLDGLDDGTLALEHVETFKALWPEVFGLGQNLVLEEARTLGERPTYEVRKRVALLWDFGGGVEETLDAGLQKRLLMYQQTAPKGSPGGVQGRPGKRLDIAGAFRPRTEQIGM